MIVPQPLDERMNDLLSRWEDLREQGQTVSAESLCADCPELASELARHIQALIDMDRLHCPRRGRRGRRVRARRQVLGDVARRVTTTCGFTPRVAWAMSSPPRAATCTARSR